VDDQLTMATPGFTLRVSPMGNGSVHLSVGGNGAPARSIHLTADNVAVLALWLAMFTGDTR
jgi:hypothetical protein